MSRSTISFGLSSALRAAGFGVGAGLAGFGVGFAWVDCLGAGAGAGAVFTGFRTWCPVALRSGMTNWPPMRPNTGIGGVQVPDLGGLRFFILNLGIGAGAPEAKAAGWSARK